MGCNDFTLPQKDNYGSSIHLSLADIGLNSRSSSQIIQVYIKAEAIDINLLVALRPTDLQLTPILSCDHVDYHLFNNIDNH